MGKDKIKFEEPAELKAFRRAVKNGIRSDGELFLYNKKTCHFESTTSNKIILL